MARRTRADPSAEAAPAPLQPSGAREARRLRALLAALRISVAVYLGLAAVRMMQAPERAAAALGAEAMPQALILAFGAAQLVIVLAFAFGLAKTLSAAAALATQAFATLSAAERLATPMLGANLAHWAEIPVLVALVFLFAYRKDDRWLSLG